MSSKLGRGYRVKPILSFDLFSASQDISNEIIVSFRLITRVNTSCEVDRLSSIGQDQILGQGMGE